MPISGAETQTVLAFSDSGFDIAASLIFYLGFFNYNTPLLFLLSFLTFLGGFLFFKALFQRQKNNVKKNTCLFNYRLHLRYAQNDLLRDGVFPAFKVSETDAI